MRKQIRWDPRPTQCSTAAHGRGRPGVLTEEPKARDTEAARTVASQGSQGLSGVAAHGSVSPTRQSEVTTLAALTRHLFQE